MDILVRIGHDETLRKALLGIQILSILAQSSLTVNLTTVATTWQTVGLLIGSSHMYRKYLSITTNSRIYTDNTATSLTTDKAAARMQSGSKVHSLRVYTRAKKYCIHHREKRRVKALGNVARDSERKYRACDLLSARIARQRAEIECRRSKRRSGRRCAEIVRSNHVLAADASV